MTAFPTIADAQLTAITGGTKATTPKQRPLPAKTRKPVPRGPIDDAPIVKYGPWGDAYISDEF